MAALRNFFAEFALFMYEVIENENPIPCSAVVVRVFYLSERGEVSVL